MSERNLTSFAARSFGLSDIEQPTSVIDMLPALPENLSPAHPGVESGNNNEAKMRGGCRKQLPFLVETHYEPWLPPLTYHLHTAQWVYGEQSFVDGPEKQVTKCFEIPIYGGL